MVNSDSLMTSVVWTVYGFNVVCGYRIGGDDSEQLNF